eukprot:m.219900 g.219900  ORF g.219900 m.219900 type:complete len:134 (+) comp39929_c1_seq2:77-478(+)
MGEPSWNSRLRKQLPYAIRPLSALLDEGNLLDHLNAKGIITSSIYDKILLLVDSAGSEKAARTLFQYLMKKQPSFRIFCEILDEVEGGEDLHELLCPNRVDEQLQGMNSGKVAVFSDFISDQNWMVPFCGVLE